MGVDGESVPIAKYWRSSPLEFSFGPLCHGDFGSQKNTWTPVSMVEVACCAISVPDNAR